jgi:hypothetical protein
MGDDYVCTQGYGRIDTDTGTLERLAVNSDLEGYSIL